MNRAVLVRSSWERALFAMLWVSTTLVPSAAARAQAPPLAELSGHWIPFSQIDAPEGLSGTTPPPQVVAQFGSFQASANIPVSTSEDAALLVGARYGLLVVDQETPSRTVDDPAVLHTAAASLLFSASVVESLRLAVRVELALAGDFASFGGDHLRLSGLALLSYDVSENVVLGLGALASWRFGELLPIPALQVRWQILEGLRLDALLPIQAALTWRVDSRVEIGLSASIDGQSYSLTSRREEWPCAGEDTDRPETAEVDERVARPDQCAVRLAFSRGEVGPTLSFGMGSSLWISAHAGLIFLRRYQPSGSDDSGLAQRDVRVEAGALVQLRLTLRLQED